MPDKATMGPTGTRVERTYRAEAALTRGRAVIPGTAEDQVKEPATAATGNLKVLGIVAETVASGDPVRIVTHGECIMIAGAAVNHGDLLKTTAAAGKAEATTTDNDGIFGHAVSDAAADTDEFVGFVDGPSRY